MKNYFEYLVLLTALTRNLKTGNKTGAIFQAGAIFGLVQSIEGTKDYNWVVNKLYAICDQYQLYW